ncbi:MAG: M23 family metallopeptidase [Microcoleaceae cyanobacterium]
MRLKIIYNTFLKARPVDTSQLAYGSKTSAYLGTEFELSSYSWAANGHIKATFTNPLPRNQAVWYVFANHVQVFDHNLVPINLIPPLNSQIPSPTPEPPPTPRSGSKPPKISAAKWRWPMTGTSMGPRTEFGYARGRLHAGVDIGGYTPDECYAASDGTVTYIKQDTSGATGRMVEITRSDGWKHVYMHLKSIKVELQQSINSGDLIGIRGGSGFGAEGLEIDGGGYSIHLHFEVHNSDGKPINPRSVLPDDYSVPILE